jgi:hypothetical protein
MSYIHPIYYTDTKLWETDQLIEGEVVTAKSLRELQTKLLRVHTNLRVKGYYPSGYGNVVKPRTSPNVAKVSAKSFQGRGCTQTTSKPKLLVSTEVPTDQLPLDLPNPLEAKPYTVDFEAPDIQPEVAFPPELRKAAPKKPEPQPEPEAEPDLLADGKKQLDYVAAAAKRSTTVVSWTPENDEKLLAFFWQGGSAPTIAHKMSEELGVTVTPNSIIGRLHRLGYQLSQR